MGGIKDAPLPEMLFMTGWGQWIDLNVYIWVIEGWKKPTIVDTGIRDVGFLTQGSGKAGSPSVREEKAFEVHRWTQSPEERTDVALGSVGVEAEEVSHIILTHLHYDHFSNISLFPYAKIVASKKGLRDDAAYRHPQVQGFIPEDALCDLITRPPDLIQLVEQDEEILPGIRIFWIGGHSPADQAVSVQMAKGRAVITSDTVFLYRNIEQNIPIGYFYNLEECYDSMERIRS